ncbi:MAG: hypothetical protein ACYDIE_04495 [Candidatus Krumholzibacteriia bacterium]
MTKRNVLPALLVVVLTGLTAAGAWAAPGVASVSGTIQEAGTLTILGSNFGTKAKAAPYRWDNFDRGVPGTTLTDEANGGWYTMSTQVGKAPTYSTARIRRPGSQSAYQDFTGGNYNSTIGLTALPDSPLYLSGWFYLTTSGAASRNAKLLQMRPEDLDVLSWECRVDQYPSTNSGHQYVSDCDGGQLAVPINNWSTVGGDLHTGAWHRLESWLDQGTTNGNNGVWTVWLDGQFYTQVTGTFMDSSDCPFHRLWLAHYYATDVGTPTPSAQRYWDELYVDFTRSRVEIGNASTWSASTHREIQVPSAWNSTGIICTVNQGTFTAGQQAWVYVVDATGVANAQGYPITFGGTSSDNPPTIGITAPSTTGAFTTAFATVTVSGTAADDIGLAQVSWSNSAGGSGVATNVSGNWTSWSIASLPLTFGVNPITVVARDTAGQTRAASISVTYDPGAPGQPGQPVR